MHQSQHFVAGVLFFVMGAVFLITGWSYPIGTMTRMGPGMFPLLASMSLMTCSALLILVSARGVSFKGWSWARLTRELRVTVIILGSVVAFGLLIERAGILVSIVVLFLLSCLAGERRSVLAALVGACALAAFIAGVFVLVLNIPMKVLP